MTTSTNLPRFEGREVIRAAVSIRKAGDGLSDALKVEPIALKHGQRVFFVIETEVRKVDHTPADKDGPELVREHVCDVVDIALVEHDDVSEMLEANRDRVQRALDSIEGQMRLDDSEA